MELSLVLLKIRVAHFRVSVTVLCQMTSLGINPQSNVDVLLVDSWVVFLEDKSLVDFETPEGSYLRDLLLDLSMSLTFVRGNTCS